MPLRPARSGGAGNISGFAKREPQRRVPAQASAGLEFGIERGCPKRGDGGLAPGASTKSYCATRSSIWRAIRNAPEKSGFDASRSPAVSAAEPRFISIMSSLGQHEHSGNVMPTAGDDLRLTRFRPGDEVFGGQLGALRRYVCIPETGALVHKPVNVTIEQAAAVPVAAITALQAARDHGHMQPGQKVLVNGASGAWVVLPCRLPRHSKGR
jgi:hypothetical protein